MNAVPVLAVDGLAVQFGESRVLHGATFAVEEGGTTALLGRNGAGKTTTLRAILGLVPHRGRVRLDGEDVGGLPAHAVVQRRVGYVPENRDVFAGLTVAENLRLAERDGRPRYDLVYDVFPDLRPRGAQRAGTLSGGQQQMLAIARALLNPNRILLIDEPTKGLAPAVVARVVDVLARIGREVTILLVEQNLAAARRLAERAIVLDQGRVVYAGSLGAFLADREGAHRHLGVALDAAP
ncbi:MAG TPA: ABC transporter ATP-binding protein [bacterium]|nr:ABC transporter ATP-binding protein [bacterium]